MKTFKIILVTYFIVFITNVDATTNPELSNPIAKDTNRLFSKIMPEAFYSYFDLNYNSRAGSNFSRFKGHANKYGFAVNTLMLTEKTLAGVYLYKVDVTAHPSLKSVSPFKA